MAKQKYQSRAARLQEFKDQIEGAKTGIEELRDEMQNWLDSIPENLQGSDKYDRVEEAVNNLDEIVDSLETAYDTEVEFPGVFG